MGGEIGFGVRWKQGDSFMEAYMLRWTNDLPYRISRVGFIQGGEELHRFIDEATPEADWPKSRSRSEIVRGEYGLVLIDFPSRSIFSRNDYFRAGRLLLSSCDDVYRETIGNVVALIKAGFVSSVAIEKKIHGELQQFRLSQERWESELRKGADSRDFILFEIILSENAFQIDHMANRYPSTEDVKGWLDRHGWVMPLAQDGWESPPDL